jgi:membrane-associated phospholipid phosphatase
MNILTLDRYLFSLINHSELPSVLDSIVVGIRNPIFWTPLYIFMVAFLWMNFGKKGLIYIGFLLVVFGAGDFISSRIIKPSVERLRPCRHEAVWVIERVRCGVAYSFPSSHATNHFALATFVIMTLGLYWKKIKLPLWIWAVSISIAQIYVGVHFPLDILGGAILGTLIGGGLALFYRSKINGIFTETLAHLSSPRYQ